MRLSRIVYVALLVIFSVRFGLQCLEMPPIVASHFGPGGQPNGWMSKGVFAIFGLLPVAVSMIIALVAPVMTTKIPNEMINLPNKDYWLVPERKSQAMTILATQLEWFGVGLIAFFIFVYELVFAANTHRTGLAEGPFMVGLVVFFIHTGFTLFRVHRAFAVPAQQA